MLLSKLSNAFGASGYEYDIRNIIKNEAKKYIEEVYSDNIGNIIAHKKQSKKKLVLDVHIDEVGFIITGHNDDGTLKFEPLGNIDVNTIPCEAVYVGEDKIPGVIGFKPIHLQSKEERLNKIKYKDCCIDVGCNSKEEVKKLISIGDIVVFSTKFDSFGNRLIKGKALDNRIGCFILLELLRNDYNLDLYGVFNCQEKIGARGAYVSSYNIDPDIAIVIDVIESKNDIKLGLGPVISIISEKYIVNKELYTNIIKIAEDKNIPYQIETCVENVRNLDAYFKQDVINISIPCRYSNSSISIASMEDIENTKILIDEFLKVFSKEE